MERLFRLSHALALMILLPSYSAAWLSTTVASVRSSSMQLQSASKHGENACFAPLSQCDQDFYAPRIVQIAGAYPGLSKQDFLAVSSEPSPEKGQWTYDFSDPDGPQLGTVAIAGSQLVHYVEDPVVIIAEHPSIGIELPKAITDPVDLVVLVDRAERGFAERKFLVVDSPSEGLTIGAYPTKGDMTEGAEILGTVVMVQIPWLPAMAPTKTGFAEADEYFQE